jgi:hypothetical protein
VGFLKIGQCGKTETGSGTPMSKTRLRRYLAEFKAKAILEVNKGMNKPWSDWPVATSMLEANKNMAEKM